jgi:hypothetical protein
MSALKRMLLQSLFEVTNEKIFRAADAFYARRREGPYRFIQSRSSDAAAEKSEDQLSRDFQGCSIFGFCNNIKRFTDSSCTSRDVRKVPSRTLGPQSTEALA